MKKIITTTSDIMAAKEKKKWLKIISRAFSKKPEVVKGSLLPQIKLFYSQKRQAIIKQVKQHLTPFYLFDRQELKDSLSSFRTPFEKQIPGCRFYYAVKVNWYSGVLKTAVALGCGLDVSSARELEFGLKAGAKQMVFSGPGKTESDLNLALKHRDKVIVHLDSFGELDKLGRLAQSKRQPITAGVRIYTRTHGFWNKFGIPLKDLRKFWQRTKKYPYLNLSGIQSHLSWNQDAAPYVQIIKDLAVCFKKDFKPADLAKIKFIDLGGGFMPFEQTAYYPWGACQGDVVKIASEYQGEEPKFLDKYYLTKAVTPEDYASGIAKAINKFLRPLVKAEYFFEPGRVLVNNCLHIVIRVVDVKAADKIIVDGGVNLVGWEGLRYEYLPIINLNNFSTTEKTCRVYGNLCMADDLWGYGLYAKKARVNDIIAIPYQGAYTFSLAQNFIKPIPPVYDL